MQMGTETETEQNNGKLRTWQPPPPPSVILGWLVEQVTILAEAMGEPMTPARLKIYAGDLVDIEQEQLAVAFQRARRECRFFPKIAEIRELAGAGVKQTEDAEMRAAWDVVHRFADKWLRWNGEYDRAYVEEGAPVLPERILDTVRRTGGWTAYLNMMANPTNFPFQQKRFFEEYLAWHAVEQIRPDHMLARAGVEVQFKALAAAKGMP